VLFSRALKLPDAGVVLAVLLTGTKISDAAIKILEIP
jgi:hypothetical protein